MVNNIRVVIDERSGVEKGIRRFKRMCESFGVVKEYRKRKEYKKPSIKMKEKLESSVKRRNKLVSKSRTRTAKI